MRLKLAEVFAENLLLRDTANTLFDTIEKAQDEEVVIDFEGVRSITGAFAHQYILRKRASRKKVIEQNMPEPVRRMFKIVSNRRKPAKHVLPPANQPIYLSGDGTDERETSNT
ncbi:MAG: STAS-like domain-containing protein [Candidatus Caldarchaeum sp.]